MAKFRAASRLTRNTFKITATKNRSMIFLLHVEWPEMPFYKIVLTCYVWRIVWLNWMAYSELPWKPFLGHQAWSWASLRRGNMFYFVYKRFFKFLSRFYVFTVLFLFERFLHLRSAAYSAPPPRLPALWYGSPAGRIRSEAGSGSSHNPSPIASLMGRARDERRRAV